MDQAPAAGNSSRRNEDIALDLLKFIASTAGFGRAVTASTGFVAPSAAKADDQVNQLLELYSRCLRTVRGNS